MPEVKVRIEKVALGQLIASAYAVYRRETEGNLFGRVYRDNGQTCLVIEGALPSQLTKRKRRAAKPDKREYPRILAVCEPIGWFHSHVPTWEKNGNSRYLDAGRVALSETDIERLRDMPEGIEIIVALNRAERMSPLTMNEHIVSGCFADGRKKYRVNIGAYYLDNLCHPRRAFLDVSYRDARIFLHG